MREINVVLRPTSLKLSALETIGVDSGAFFCSTQQIPMLFAIGDFDSVTPEQLDVIKEFCDDVREYPTAKNETDFEIALSYLEYYDVIYVYGALGDRKDHEYLNVLFAADDKRIILLDENHRIYRIDQGVHLIRKDGYYYVSILPLETGSITLEGFKYPLNKMPINRKSRFLTSNEILKSEAKIHLHQGSALVIESKII